MIDINILLESKGGNPELVRQSQRNRGCDPSDVDKIIELYNNWTKSRFDLDALNKQINQKQKEIGLKMKKKEDASSLIKEKSNLQVDKESLILKEKEKEELWKSELSKLGNIVHYSVPVSNDEDNNEIIRHWNPEQEPVKNTEILPHHIALSKLGGFDQDRGTKVAGHRGYFLLNEGVELNLALINYGLQFLRKKGYDIIQTPFFMNKDQMSKTAQLSQFDEELYKVVGDGEDKYLIATSEQPISAFHSNEWFEKPSEMLPQKYAGYSTCFRKEAGAHGKDTWGIFRVHQFEKLEQFVLTEPEKSWEMFDEMIQNSEEFYQSLKLPYRIVSIVSGALNNAAAKKYDLEAWFPYQGEYKELVSCSNCTDYQSRRLEIRCGTKKMGESKKNYVHCLNSTLSATGRAICCILENYQTKEGVNVPEVLVPYMGGRTFLPFKISASKNSK